MNKCFLVFFLMIFVFNAEAQVKISAKLKNEATGLPVPFASILVDGTSIGTTSNEEGCFTICVDSWENTDLVITHLSYRSLYLKIAEILDSSEFVMEELPIEINPAIISATAAQDEIFRAIDSTAIGIKKNKYFSIYQWDKIEKDGILLAEAKAVIECNKISINKPGQGAKTIHNISHYSLNVLDTVFLDFTEFSFYSHAIINSFGVGNNDDVDSNIVFSKYDQDDTTLVISFRPKSSYMPIKKEDAKEGFFIMSGQYIIDKRDWRITIYNMAVDKPSINQANIFLEKAKRPKICNFSQEMTLSKSGIPTKCSKQYSFEKTVGAREFFFKMTSEQLYIPSSKENNRKSKTSLDSKNTLFMQKYNTLIPPPDGNFEKFFE